MGAAAGSLTAVILGLNLGLGSGLSLVSGLARGQTPVAQDSECSHGASQVRQLGDVRLNYRLSPERPAVGVPFAVHACARLVAPGATDSRPASRIRFDARMPQHGHGMNYQPSIHAEAQGWVRFDGSVLHMPGRWQLVFDVYDDQKRHRFTADVDIR